jgi:4-carboxymuconolactone decarboxylase
MEPRLPVLIPDDMDPSARRLYDAITGGPRERTTTVRADRRVGRPVRPVQRDALRTELGAALQELGAAVRYRPRLSARIRETAILVVANCWDSAFERYAHEAVGRTAGLTDEELAALRTGMSPGFSDTAEQTAYAVAQALTMRQGLSDTEYARAHEILGKAAIVELSTLIGYYAPLALQLRTFRVGVSPNLDS